MIIFGAYLEHKSRHTELINDLIKQSSDKSGAIRVRRLRNLIKPITEIQELSPPVLFKDNLKALIFHCPDYNRLALLWYGSTLNEAQQIKNRLSIPEHINSILVSNAN